MMTLRRIQRTLDDMVKDLGFKKSYTLAERSGRWLHVLISTKDFEGKTQMERESIIWREFEKRLDDPTLISITQCYLLTPKEFEETFAKIAPARSQTGLNRRSTPKNKK